jgi:hypothetical protein
MAKQLIDLSEAPRYGGLESDIEQITNGQPATAAVFNAPPQDLRERMEALREKVEDLNYLADADRALLLSLSGTLTATQYTGGTIAWGLSLSESGYLLIRPFVSKASVGSITLSSAVKLTVSSATDAPKAWGQYSGGAPGPALRGANNIKVRVVSGSSLGAVVDVGLPDAVTITVPSSTTANTLVAFLNGNDTTAGYKALKLTASVVSGQGSTVISSSAYAYVTGANNDEQHKITASNLSAFFTDEDNRLESGDTLALAYDTLVEMAAGSGADGGRRQITSSTALGNNLFNTRVEPAKIPGCIPVATVQDGKVFLLDGTVMSAGESITGSGGEYLALAGGVLTGALTVNALTTLGDGTSGHGALLKGSGNTLGVGGSGTTTLAGAPFRVTSAGAVTAASVDTGSGAVTTTGQVNAATVVATTSVTTPLVTGGASTGLNVGTSGQTTAVLGHETVAGNLDVEGTLKAGTGDAFAVSASGAVTAASVNTSTGAISGGTLTAITKVTSSEFSNGTGNFNIGHASATATVLGSLKVNNVSTLGSGDSDDHVLVQTGSDTDVALAVGTGSSVSRSGAPLRVKGDGELVIRKSSADKAKLTSDGALSLVSKLGVGNIDPDSAPFKVTSDGDVTAVDVSATTVTAVTLTATGNTSLGNGSGDTTLVRGSGDTFGVGAASDSTVSGAPFRVTSAGAVTAASVTASGAVQGATVVGTTSVTTPLITGGLSAGMDVGTAGQTTAVLGHGAVAGNLDVAGTLKSGTDDAFQVDADGDVTAKSLTLGDSSDASPAGSLIVYNGTTDSLAIGVKDSGGRDVFKVDGDADVQVGNNASLSFNTDGSLKIYNDTNNTTKVVDVVNVAGTSKFSVTSAGAVAASSLTLGSVAVEFGCHTQLFSSLIFIQGNGGTPAAADNNLALALAAGTYVAMVTFSYVPTTNLEDSEVDWALLTASEQTSYPTTVLPSTLSSSYSIPYITSHGTQNASAQVTLIRKVVLTASEDLVLRGYRSGTASQDVVTHGSVTLIRVPA